MLLNISKLSAAALVLMSASSLASVTTTHFGSVSDTGTNFNQFSVSSGGVNITVSGWADTAGDGANSDGISSNGDDDIIRKAVDFDKNGNGWSMENRDEKYANGSNTGFGGYHHSADNLKGGSQDYDMFLVEFSEAVNLSAASYSWRYGSTGQNQVSVAALNNKNLDGKTWSDVKNNQTISSGYSQMQSNSGYYTNFTNNTSNVSGTFSRFWLIGALNAVFGGNSGLEGDDGMKLAGVSFTKQGTPPPPIDVAEPTTVAIFGLALMGLFATSRRKVK